MGIVTKVPTAREQIRQIVNYIAANNLSASLNWLDRIEALFSLLATQPHMGQEVHTKSLGTVRRHVFGSYSIYYLPIPSGVEIVRVFHSARDQDRLV